MSSTNGILGNENGKVLSLNNQETSAGTAFNNNAGGAVASNPNNFFADRRFMSDKAIAGKLIMDGITETTEQNLLDIDNQAKAGLSQQESNFWQKSWTPNNFSGAAFKDCLDPVMIKTEDFRDENGHPCTKFTPTITLNGNLKPLILRRNSSITPVFNSIAPKPIKSQGSAQPKIKPIAPVSAKQGSQNAFEMIRSDALDPNNQSNNGIRIVNQEETRPKSLEEPKKREPLKFDPIEVRPFPESDPRSRFASEPMPLRANRINLSRGMSDEDARGIREIGKSIGNMTPMAGGIFAKKMLLDFGTGVVAEKLHEIGRNNQKKRTDNE